jgi:hypothetical protein
VVFLDGGALSRVMRRARNDATLRGGC